jgi:hypothetical protein
MNPETKLSEIAFKLNFFISWPNFTVKNFSRHSGYTQHFSMPLNDPRHVPFGKGTRPQLFMGNPSLHLIITLNYLHKLSPTCDKSYLSCYYSSLHISLGIINDRNSPGTAPTGCELALCLLSKGWTCLIKV